MNAPTSIPARPPRLSAIAAMAEGNRAIGIGGDLPWRLPEDLRAFKRRTQGHPVVMGRKTWDSLGGKPLPNRRNIVLSRSLASAPGAEVIGAPEDLGSLGLEGEVFIIGDQKIYEIFLPQCETLYLTAVRGDFPGDAFFPPFEDAFALDQVEMATPAFEIRVYRRR